MARVIRTLQAALRTYAALVFAHDARAGAVLALSTCVQPRTALGGALTLAATQALARALRLAVPADSFGSLGVNALLLGLGFGAAFRPCAASGVLWLGAIVLLVGLHAAARGALELRAGLPVLGLPFATCTWVALACAAPLGLAHFDPVLASAGPLRLGVDFLRALGAFVFIADVRAGAIVLAALLVWSRRATLLALVGFLVAAAAVQVLVPADGVAPVVFGFDGALAAIALGGVFFLSDASGFVLAAAGALASAMFAFALQRVLGAAGLPMLVAPFNAAVLLALLAMRQRARDGSPRSVDVFLGTPERTLAHFRERQARFGARFAPRLGLPVSGAWTVTQGVDAAVTHQGAWRDAIDLEVLEDGGVHRGSGERAADFACHRLPVLAAGDGVVVAVVRDVPDNAVGQTNPESAWGNVVVIHHGPALYSLVAHLAHQSARVVEGQRVRRGDPIGLCGNSGRSLRPHVHFQLQAEPRVGAPTLPLELHDVVALDGDRAALRRFCTPAVGQTLRNLEHGAALAKELELPLGKRFHAELDGRSHPLEVKLDAWNRITLGSGSAALHVEQHRSQLLALGLDGESELLALFAAAAPRVPFDPAPALTWTERVPLTLLGARGSVELAFERRMDADGIEVVGRGSWRGAALETRARFMRNHGPVALALTHGARRWFATISEVDDARAAGEPAAAGAPRVA